MCLDTIFDEEGMTHVIVCDILLNRKMMYSMNGYSTVEGIVNSALFDVRFAYISNHMEIDRIATEGKCLTCVEEL